MVTLYKYRGQIDLIVADPPYNTGQYFRYNDRWDEDPNDPDLGMIVTKEDGSRHTKWMKAMLPRLQMMKAMLKPQGVVAICIDDNELFDLGLMMDETFGEENRIAIINWQKTTPKNDARHVGNITEYVLVYAKDVPLAKTGLLERKESTNRRFNNPDNDKSGKWQWGDLTARDFQKSASYNVQSPFTGELFGPGRRHWANKKAQMKEWLEEWGTPYEELGDKDDEAKALVLKGWSPKNAEKKNVAIIAAAKKRATEILERGSWPLLYWGQDGNGAPAKKHRLESIKAGAVPTTFWIDPEEHPLKLDTVSWPYTESGRTRDGVEELDALVGTGHGFDTVKPLKLIQKIIQLWCPPAGVVMDPYGGSGTTGHAVLALNKTTDADRRFILIEQGSPENGDKYARTLTWERLKNAITGGRPDKNGKLKKTEEALGGGFEFRVLTSQIDAKTVLSMKKDELVDVVITSHWETGRRNSPNLVRIEDPQFTYLVGKNQEEEGYFIIWHNGGGPVGQLDIKSYNIVLQDGKKAGLKPPYHVYARYEVYQSKNVRFYKIPDKILAHLGLNENSDPYNEAGKE